MLEKLKEYFEMEYQDAKELLTNRPGWIRTKQDERILIDRTISRCLGAVMFSQIGCGVAYENLDFYDEYKEKIDKLLDN